MNKRTALNFILFALITLFIGIVAGLLGGLQYVNYSFLKDVLPFSQIRSIHVTSVISWIVLAATGGIYYYISEELKQKLYSGTLVKLHFLLYVLTGIAIYFSLFSGKMGGREYMTFLPALMIPVLIGWVLFAINYYKSLLKRIKSWPVYLWMWGTGIVFMIIHLCEANLWIFDYFRSDFIRDLSVQWKSYGSFTGSYNLLVYGTAIYLMTKIKGDERIATSKTAFFFYFLGLSNLMFGWAHHIYPVPSMPWIRMVAYAISMTEWIVLAHMITQWVRSLGNKEKKMNLLAYRMLVITDIWVFFNVFMALLISIPAINHYTHGSHMTVAHAMGTTIGIDTTILLASCLYILSKLNGEFLIEKEKLIKIGLAVFNISLVLFLTSMIIAGIIKGLWQYGENVNIYGDLMDRIKPYIYIVVASGFGLFAGFAFILIPIIKGLFQAQRSLK